MSTQTSGVALRIHKQAIDFLALTRPRVVLMVLVTTFVGYRLGSHHTLDWVGVLKTLLGVALAAGGTVALNQYLERDGDARMERTRRRPVPDGRLQPRDALTFGVAITSLGLLELLLAVSPLSAILTAISVVSYLLLYTPLKRKSPLSTLVGAIPGALPPVAGWAAVQGQLELEAWVLFAILFLWQIPHSLAIAWLYRDDYARAGIRFLPVIDPDGRRSGFSIVSHCLALLLVGLLPARLGLAGPIYFFGAFSFGVAFLACAFSLAILRSTADARRLVFASLVYLPAVLLLLTLDKV